MALTDTQAMQVLAGRGVVFAVPAEEFVDGALDRQHAGAPAPARTPASTR